MGCSDGGMRFFSGLVSGYAHVDWYLWDSHYVFYVLELLKQLYDVREDVNA